jgi:hypothetical protein
MGQKLLVIICGVIFLFIFLFYFFKRERIRKHGFNVTGEITGFHTDGDSKYAIIRFKTLSGEVIEEKYHASVGFNTKIGDRVPIVYDPAKPTNFYINSYWEKLIILLIIAFIIALISISLITK